jgi:putative membrane protein
MRHVLYFVVMAAAMMALSTSGLLPGFRVDGFGAALAAAVVLALANTLLKPVLFVLTLPFTILTLGLFLLVLNALMLWVTTLVVPGVRVDGPVTTLLASLALAVVGVLWKAFSGGARKRRRDD